jgi:DNA repair protein RecN (Recombination protein N)
MLRELRISNFAIIDELQLSFAAGMNVLTGETGAGKSIIMRAIGLLCGDRGSTDLIRTDAEEAEIEGLFEIGDGAWLEACGLAPIDELLVRRIINRSGKGRAYLNGSLATAGVLGQLGDRIIHVYGQHEHALLLKPESHLELLDQFADLAPQRTRMAGAYAAFRDAADRLAALLASGDATRQRLELLRFQVKELRDAQPAHGEERELHQERDLQRHAEKLMALCRQSEEALYSGDHAVAAGVGRIAAQLRDAERIDAALHDSAELLGQAEAQIEEVALQLRRAAERIRHDPERLEEIEARLALLGRLKRKYECDADGLAERLAEFDAEIGRLEHAGLDVSAARQDSVTCAAQAWEVAKELSRVRQAAAGALEKRMADELRALGMRGAVFRVVFTVAASDGPQPGAHGKESADPATAGLSPAGGDVVQFYLSANPGEEPKPLARIASGGELSRIMLGLKALTAGAGDVPTLIFDEVDAGIGGAVAEAVGKRLRALGRSRQVLCITHLPQIAAQADHHFAVEKRVVKGRTTTTARALRADERVRELTRMLGDNAGAESERYARRLMQSAERSEAR